ncbi:MAG: hypothetical protein ACTHQQ_19690, partial [Solirubrobacteraceae bacterium]
MSDSEIQSWLSEQATSGRPALMLSRGHLATGPVLLVRAVEASAATAASEQLADLMMDMRLLG